MNFTERQVEQYEILADALKNFDYVSDNMEKTFLMVILNIESLLPYSNIFEYVFKTDINKDKKLQLQSDRKNLFENVDELNGEMSMKIEEHNKLLEELGEKISNSYNKINSINTELSNIDNEIDESEWRIDIDSHEEFIFNKIKEKLIIEKKLNYGSI
jgi:peptidoglycan hydrolase CwlO-like protein